MYRVHTDKRRKFAYLSVTKQLAHKYIERRARSWNTAHTHERWWYSDTAMTRLEPFERTLHNGGTRPHNKMSYDLKLCWHTVGRFFPYSSWQWHEPTSLALTISHTCMLSSFDTNDSHTSHQRNKTRKKNSCQMEEAQQKWNSTRKARREMLQVELKSDFYLLISFFYFCLNYFRLWPINDTIADRR